MTENPLLKALPPETDYLTYLTILEYNLTEDQLPTLHDILQDTTLTANIGWDLVHLLLPLLPTSLQCLQDVARLGNPREVVLKVTELLESIGLEEVEEGENERAEDAEEVDEDKATGKGEETTEAMLSEGASLTSGSTKKIISPVSKDVQFIMLLEMLSILHPRIKTKYPSRFLATSLKAILPAYSRVATVAGATEAVIGFIKALSGVRRPRLPPRKSSTMVSLQQNYKPESAPDPEGKDEALAPDETALQTRLLQSFLTHLTEEYVSSLTFAGEIFGLAWCSRLQEKLHPEKLIPYRKTHSEMFAEEEVLHRRDAVMGQIVALARDLNISSEELLAVATEPEPRNAEVEDDLPLSASDVPLSHIGSLHLLSATAAASALLDVPTSLPPMKIFPTYTSILTHFLYEPSTGRVGTEPSTLIDTILFLGFFILNDYRPSTLPESDETFTSSLQYLSLLSANNPSPTLRYNAHLLTASLLHSHPSDHVRLAFIRDTLEHCPYENLKASSIGWLKNELLLANTKSIPIEVEESPSIFATPTALTTLAPSLFPDLSHPEDTDHDQTQQHPLTTRSSFEAHQPFYLSVLNLLFLLLSSPSLFSALDIPALTEEYDIHSRFLGGLSALSMQFRKEQEGEEDDFELLSMSLERVTEKMKETGI